MATVLGINRMFDATAGASRAKAVREIPALQEHRVESMNTGRVSQTLARIGTYVCLVLGLCRLDPGAPEARSAPPPGPAPASAVRVGMARGPIGRPPGAATQAGTQPARERPVHDPLEAIVCFFDDGRAPAALIALDMSGMPYARGRALREELAARCEMAADSIILYFTHTHTGGRAGAGVARRAGWRSSRSSW